MKKINLVIAVSLIAVLLSITALSQLSPIINIISKTTQITPTISLEEKNTCTTSFYDKVQDVYENCIHYHNYTRCLNTTGSNTACSLQQDQINFQCKIGETTVIKNTTECRPNNEFIISIDQGTATLKKQIDFSDWGPCVYEAQNSCLIVTCQSIYDGANDGKFHGCKGGTSCQKFEICDNSIKTFYKNSRENFVEDDPTFHLNELAIKETAK
ncbi:hypothetical protein HYW19_01470 [Candidatus Woesearchaeota archaeon]|nr:hypothetical protein [Candidatus Woesearchaeota archaeon]